MLSLTNLTTHTKYATGNRTDIDTLITAWINHAYRDIWNILPNHNKEAVVTTNGATPPVTLVTVVGTDYITIPSGIFAINQVLLDGTRLWKTDWRRYTDSPKPHTSGTPTEYCIYGNRIYFNLLPDEALGVELWVIKALTALSTGTDVPDLPDDFEAALCSLAIGYTWRGLNNPEKASAWLQTGYTQLNYAKQVYDHETQDQVMQIQMAYVDGEN